MTCLRRLAKHASKVLTMLMILSLMVPPQVMADSSSVKDEQAKAENKLGSDLLEAYQDEEFVKYLVILEDQTDTQAVSEKAINEAETSLSSDEKEKKIQQAVVSELQQQADTSQNSILSYLEEDKNIQDYHSYFIINGLAVTGTQETAEKIASLPEVKSVILDGEQKLPEPEKNDAGDDDIEWNINHIGAPEAWENDVTGEGTVVANIDSGVDGDHPALKENYRGYNPDDPDNPSHEFNWHDAVSDRKSPMDSDDHGTHTMGTMVGHEKDSNQIGVAPGAEWIAARAFFGEEGHDSDIIEAAEWVLAPTDDEGEPHPEKAPDVVNNSWGGNTIDNDWFLPMVEAWRSAGIVPIFSVGNTDLFQDPDPGTASAPGNYEEVIAVGAVDDEDQLADFSLRGPSEDGVIKPDIAAPGVSIRSSIPGESFDEFDYDVSNGTSMAAPHVAGVVSLMKDVDPELTVEAIESILKLTADSKTDDEYEEVPNNGYGYGVLSANAAVEAVQEGIGTMNGQVTASGEDNEAPTYSHDPRAVVFTDRDESFYIQAMDDISVESVTLNVLIDGETEEAYESDRTSGDHLEGTYEAIIPPDDLKGEELEYWWTIEDFAGNKTNTDKHQADIRDSVKAGYIENFEAYPDGWYSYGTKDSWEWGVPEYGPESAASGDKVMGTNLKGQYGDNADMTLVMPPVLVEENTILRFKNWYKLTQLGNDTGTVLIFQDGESWEPLHQVRQENDHWHEIGLDLAEYAGERVQIAFNVQTGDNENDGWYIDDVRLDEDDSNVTEPQLYDEDISLDVPGQDDQTSLIQSKNSDEQDHQADEGDTLPVDAHITVEETGWETDTNSQNGEFTIHHTPGDYELNVDAYGYEKETVPVTLDEKGEISPQIELTPLPEQTVSGYISSTTGEPVENARVFLLEDENNEPVQSSEDGNYNLNVYEGSYTLKVYADGYFGKSEYITVEPGEDIDLDIDLEPFHTADPSEIKYDSGEYGKNLAFGKAGNGFAVKMSLDEDESSAILKGAKLQFWAEHVPVPGGEDILISVFDATGEDGAPGHKLAGPIEAKAERDLDKWTEVDLSDLGITVEDDFYIAYLQADDYPYIPGFVTDGDSSNYAGRSWDYIGGEWHESNEDAGNYMIRANVDYGDEQAITEPEITSPDDNSYTNDEDITVEGEADKGSTVTILNDEKEVTTTEVHDDGSFSAPITLEDGENVLTAVASVESGTSEQSSPVTVTLDQDSPEVTIDSPEDGAETDMDITVEGTATDDYLAAVEVNGESAEVADDGSFSHDLSLDEGENDISVTAIDKAGNESTEQITVYAESEGPEITNLKPSEDQHLRTGQPLMITMDTEPGLEASFVIHSNEGEETQITDEIPMIETNKGHYIGVWTPTSDIEAEGAIVEVTAKDEDGTKTTKEAEGQLYINVER